MRCDQCNKFVSFDDSSEPESELEVELVKPKKKEDDRIVVQVSGTVRGVLTCAECSQELKESIFDVDQEHILAETGMAGLGEGKPEINVDSGELTSRTETKDRYGKPIKSSRYMKSFYGVSVEYTVTIGGATGTFQFEDECQASSWDELI